MQNGAVTRPGAPLTELFERAVEHARQPSSPADAQIFRAAVAVLGRRGTRAATMDDVAAASKVSRATLFRRFGTKDQLFERALGFAVENLLGEITQIFAAVPDSADRIVETFAICLRFGSALVPRGADPQHAAEMLSVLTRGNPSLMDIGHQFVSTQIIDGQRAGRIPSGDPDMKAEALIRITLGYLVTPSRFDLTDPDAVRAIARAVVAPVVTGPGQ